SRLVDAERVCKYHQLLIESPSTTPNRFVTRRTVAVSSVQNRPVGSRKVPVDVELAVLADAIKPNGRPSGE
ncbi:hypothetical protein, partial [Lentzea kentuckyensis]|uniref:hypothetical protein n=1 Tax=Lentzea kentuckyensis TaxID=360086 RepID=UPI001B8053E7